MNHRIAMSKFLQQSYLALNNHQQHGELHVTAMIWRRRFNTQRHRRDSPCNADALTMTTTTSRSSATMMTTPLMTSSKRYHSKFTAGHHYPTARLGTAPPLCQEKAYELIVTLTDEERTHLKAALTKYDAIKLKEGFEGRLAANQWRTRFGRLTKVPPPLSNVDPSGEFCTFPEDWLKKNAAAQAVPPAVADLWKIFFVNAVPFVAFGFLDNFCMIMAGDYIEHVVGTFMCLSTMAAAGLGNTISDILGIGTAFYVESFCAFMGLKAPELSVAQMEMKQSRRAANIGRILGITLGCILGMFPLIFLKKRDEAASKTDQTKKGH